jgi:hypothetical protein
MVLYTIGLAYILAYSVFKAQGIWIAAFLHAINNQAMAFFMMAVYTPNDMTFSFGIGLPGLAVLAVVVLLILRDPLWRQAE